MAAIAREIETRIDPEELDRVARSLLDLAAELRSQADEGFHLPDFASEEERERWFDSRPTVEVEVAPGLLETVNTSIRLSRSTIDAYTSLATSLGLRSGQTLMKIVLNNFLAHQQGIPSYLVAGRFSLGRVRPSATSLKRGDAAKSTE